MDTQKLLETLQDARASHEKDYQYEKQRIGNGGSEIAAGQARRYADAIATAAIQLGYGKDRQVALIEALAALADRFIDYIPQLPKALHQEAFGHINAARAAIRAAAK